MSEEILKNILIELKNLNSTLSSIQLDVMNVDSKLDTICEYFDSENSSEKIIDGISGVRNDISDLEKKMISEMPSTGNLEFIAQKEFKEIKDVLKDIKFNTQ